MTTATEHASATSTTRWQAAAIAPATAGMVAEILDRAAEAERDPAGPLSFAAYASYGTTGERTAFQALYRRRRQQLTDLALAALVEPERGTDALADLIWSICDEYSWAFPAHIDELLSAHPRVPHAEQVDLGAAETAAALAEITSSLSERLPALVVRRAHSEIRRRVLSPFAACEHWWETAPTNWASVCAGGILLAGIRLLDETELAGFLPRLRAALECYLSGFDEDGVCSEGVDYWHYGFSYFAAAAEALRDHSTGAIDLWDEHRERLSLIARFPGRVRLTGDVVASFADTRPTARLDRALLSRLSERLPGISVPPSPDAVLSGDQRFGRWVPASRGLLWNAPPDSNASATVAPERPSADYLPHAQWLIVRDSGGSAFAARGGHNDELHNHNDIGSFILAARGEVLLADPGVGVYDRDYFSDRRYENPATGSQGHSVPIVDGVTQRGWARDAAARVDRIEHSPGRARFAIEYSSAYAVPGLRELRRCWTYADGELVIDDALSADRPMPVVFRFVSLLPIVATAAGRAEISGEHTTAELLFPESFTARIGVFSTDLGVPRPVHHLDLIGESSVAAELRTTIRVHGIPS